MRPYNLLMALSHFFIFLSRKFYADDNVSIVSVNDTSIEIKSNLINDLMPHNEFLNSNHFYNLDNNIKKKVILEIQDRGSLRIVVSPRNSYIGYVKDKNSILFAGSKRQILNNYKIVMSLSEAEYKNLLNMSEVK